MRTLIYIKILPLLALLVLLKRPVFAEDRNNLHNTFFKTTDTLKNPINNKLIDSQPSDSSKNSGRNILDVLYGVNKDNKIISWRIDNRTFELELIDGVDTTLNFPHLLFPLQKNFENSVSPGNLGSPVQSDHFFSRNSSYKFLFSRFYRDYLQNQNKSFHLYKPFTQIVFTMGGKTSESEQIFRVLHSQNVNKYLNVSISYDHFGTKGIYSNQLTKNNFFTISSNYYKNKISFQGSFIYNRIRNQENGGLTDDFFIVDTTMENKMIPFNLKSASSEVKERGFYLMGGYNLINRWTTSINSEGEEVRVKKPILTIKAVFDANKYTRIYEDTSKKFYKYYYISKGATHDSVMLSTYETTIIGEIDQIAKFPGLPGLKFWVSNISGNYYYFKPGDFIINRDNDRISSNHFGIGVFSYSPYLSYSGSLRTYISGYRADDKELFGQLTISPWKSLEMPYVKGKIEINDKEPDIFMKDYFSNNYKWENSFDKEKWFLLGGSIGAEKWRFEAGYNIARINNYTYFDTTGVPKQTSGITVTSAYVYKEIKLGVLHFTNKVIWQANTNTDVLSLPTFSFFSSLFFEYELVKNVLVGQIGASVFYRTKFYANAYSPATGQFYNQNTKEIGEYPVVDAFVNFKWKRAVLFFKFDHVNQGIPNNEYFSTIHYPLNQRVFKLGVSWNFYD